MLIFSCDTLISCCHVIGRSIKSTDARFHFLLYCTRVGLLQLPTRGFEVFILSVLAKSLPRYMPADKCPDTLAWCNGFLLNPFYVCFVLHRSTFLHLAIIHEDDFITQHLIEIFPKEVLDIQNNLYQSPLHLATYLNLTHVVKSLVGKGVSLELQDQDGNTALHVACQHGQTECASEMTSDVSPSKLAPVLETQNWRGLTCLHLAALNRQHPTMKLLVKKGADLNIQEGTSGKTALHLAVELHDVASVKLLLSRGANVDAAMLNGCTPLHLAVGRQDAAIANLLCQAGADTMLRNMEDETALDLADGNDDILALFPFDDIQISGRSVVGVKF
ncbi:putative NF-kappa-B inhibitor epsilon [Scophthalmus maximus]|uniref:Putative NF-kappa-B inhibitor epsilon n=1 Tax=Scophthalmus maximus TaxID=52904 RepID=A0A2U9CWD5_SCOMX|nr:putative NF-kappa-B inhibitor epsilon [Scophthalmus maximus]